MPLVELEEAKDHLRITSNASDGDTYAKLEEASDIILDYLGTNAIAGWSAGTVTVPGVVKTATKLMLTHLYEHRGDDPSTDAELWASIERLLVRYRTPALA